MVFWRNFPTGFDKSWMFQKHQEFLATIFLDALFHHLLLPPSCLETLVDIFPVV